MKRKRMKKLLMAKGFHRNFADCIGKKITFFEEDNIRWTNKMVAERLFPALQGGQND